MIQPPPISTLFPYTTLFRSHIVRNNSAVFFADPKEVVDGRATGKNDGAVIKNVDLLLTKILGSNSFYLNELSKVNFHIVFFGQVKVRRFGRAWLGLRNQNFFDLQSASVLVQQK